MKVTALYGRFVRAIAQGGVEGIVRGVPAYERWGQGVKLTLGRFDLTRELFAHYLIINV